MYINGKYNQVKDSSSDIHYRGSYKGGTQDNYYYAMADLDNVSTSSQLTFISGQYKLKNYQRSRNGYGDDVSLGRISVDTYCKRQEHSANFNPSYIFSSDYTTVAGEYEYGPGGTKCTTDSKCFLYVGIRTMKFHNVIISYGTGPNSGNKPEYFRIYSKKVNSNEYN